MQLTTRLGELAALALVLPESADPAQRTSLTDARYLAEIPRSRAARWIDYRTRARDRD